MTNIIVVLPKLEEAKGVKSILVRSGFQVTGICTTGTQAISQADGLNDGIVICSYKLADMIYTELHEDLPEGFEMLLMASQNLISECYGNGIVCLSMPLKVQDLINTVNLMFFENRSINFIQFTCRFEVVTERFFNDDTRMGSIQSCSFQMQGNNTVK